jgi:hypothetical protein
VCVSVVEVDFDHNEIMNVGKVISDLLFGDPTGHAACDEVSRCTSDDLVRDVGWDVELTISPAELKL